MTVTRTDTHIQIHTLTHFLVMVLGTSGMHLLPKHMHMHMHAHTHTNTRTHTLAHKHTTYLPLA